MSELTRLALDLKAAYERVKSALITIPPRQQLHWDEGGASTVDFIMPKGWKPLAVYDGGLLRQEGSSNYYTVSSAHNVYTVTFNAAPANLNELGFLLEESK